MNPGSNSIARKRASYPHFSESLSLFDLHFFRLLSTTMITTFDPPAFYRSAETGEICGVGAAADSRPIQTRVSEIPTVQQRLL